MSVREWDPKGEYAEVVKAVESAGGKAKVFRTEEGSRVEYWVVAVDGEGRVVGLRARAVES